MSKEIKRLNEEELREFYINEKTMEKNENIFMMIILSIATAGFVGLFIALKIYWLLAVPLACMIFLIITIRKFSRVLEEIYANKNEEKNY